MGCCGA
ncbi:hypothetical protein E2C01_082435 [Portunus trituberculatus]|nr:hypothetical protein [Portunus trituberculatus]